MDLLHRLKPEHKLINPLSREERPKSDNLVFGCFSAFFSLIIVCKKPERQV